MIEEIEITEIRKLATAIQEKYNYDFSNYAISSFRRRISRIMELYKYESTDKLTQHVCDDPKFFKDFLSELTVNVTEMFRDPSLWRELRDKILPNLFSVHNEIKIWHAGCSSGEEVYTLAMVIKEMGMLHKVKTWATDIDHTILAKAREGKYPMKNMSEVNEKNYIRYGGVGKLSDYYQVENGLGVMDKSLIEHVTFREHDLVKGPAFSKFDLVLCRNVLIYFNQNLQNDVLKLFHESLFNYGYLIIGSKESIIWCDVANKFITVNNEEKVFKKVKE